MTTTPSLRDRLPYSAIVDRPPLEAARRRADGRVDDRQRRGLGDRAGDAAHSAAAADGPAAAARPAELGLARVRHARRLLAALRLHAEVRHHADARDQRHRVPEPTRASRRRRRTPAGSSWRHGYVQGPMHKRRRPARRDPRHDRGDPRVHRQGAARLGEPGPHRDLRDARLPRRGGHRVRRRLGPRRPAGVRSRPRTGRWSRSRTRSR